MESEEPKKDDTINADPVQTEEVKQQDENCVPNPETQVELAAVKDSHSAFESIRRPQETTPDLKKDADKIGIYKALAIKLKKELVKCREELQKLRENSIEESTKLHQDIESLRGQLESEKLNNVTTSASLEATVKSLRHQLETSENDLHKLKAEFENYRLKATQIMQQNNPVQMSMANIFEENRYKQLKALNEEQQKQISDLKQRFSIVSVTKDKLERESKMFQEQYDGLLEELKILKSTEKRCTSLARENENLKSILKQFCMKPSELISTNEPQTSSETNYGTDQAESGGDKLPIGSEKQSVDTDNCDASSGPIDIHSVEPNCGNLTPKEESSQTTTNSSVDGSTSGYVHIKPATFEIISRSSVLEDAQNQIDHLTKAYLDSESTNALLTEQVKALKEEIRRVQRGNERMDLAENLEYLKNIVFKFLTIETGQVEQKQRLVTVLSTVLKLSPDETSRLMQLASSERASVASSFFKF